MGTEDVDNAEAGKAASGRANDLEFGYEGLTLVADLIYAGAIGLGMLRTAESFDDFLSARTHVLTSLFLLIITTVYLILDYAQARRCLGRYPYNGLMRFSVDIAIAMLFVISFVQASHSSPDLLVTFPFILVLGTLWVVLTRSEYPSILHRWKFVAFVHIFPAFILLICWGYRLWGSLKGADLRQFDNRLTLGLIIAFVAWSCLISTYASLVEFSLLEQGLLPILPLIPIIKSLRRRSKLLIDASARIWDDPTGVGETTPRKEGQEESTCQGMQSPSE
jgi:hypothetical protein